MKLTLVVDANPILSALLGGAARHVFFDVRFDFVTTAFTIEEVHKYLPRVSKKSGMPTALIQDALALLPITVYRPNVYKQHYQTAVTLMRHIDSKDVDILALYLKYGTYLWTHDKDFEQVKPVPRIVHTTDLLP